MIMHPGDQALAIRALKNAAPYIRMYKGKTFVVKAGGAVFADIASTRVLIEQIAILHYFGVRVVLVHGGGPQLTELATALGVPTRMVEGRRVTDQKSIDVSAMVLNGLINTRILGICRDLDIEAVGISGVDAGLVRAHKRPPVKISSSGEMVDFGFVGDIDEIDPTAVRKLLDNGLMPVVSPLSADDNGMLLNINADTVAAAMGAALGAEKLVLCTGAPGILERRLRSRVAHFLHRSAGPETPARRGAHRRRHAAEGEGHRGRDPRRRAARARGVLPGAGGHPRRGVYQRGDRYADCRGHQGADPCGAAGSTQLTAAAEPVMTRLWDKGAPLDDRVLRYTAGEDFALDERLVRYDVRASIAHAQMLHQQKLLSAADLESIRGGLTALAEEHAARPVAHRARGRGWSDGARAPADRAHRTCGRARPSGTLAQ